MLSEGVCARRVGSRRIECYQFDTDKAESHTTNLTVIGSCGLRNNMNLINFIFKTLDGGTD